MSGGLLGGFADIWAGKKTGGREARAGYYEELPDFIKQQQEFARGVQERGRGRLEDIYSADPAAIGRGIQESEIQQSRGAYDDSRRRLQQLMAQRGINNRGTMLGQSQQLGLERSQMERERNIQASMPERIRAIREQYATGMFGTGSAALASPGVQRRWIAPREAVEATRKGGIAPIVGAVAGGVLSKGNPAAMQAGMQMGNYSQSMF